MKKITKTKSATKARPSTAAKKTTTKKITAKKPPAKKNTAKKFAPKKNQSQTARSKPAASKQAAIKQAALKQAALKKPLAKKATPKAAKKNGATSANRETNMAAVIHKALDDMKGKDIVSLDVHHLTDVMDIMMVVSGTSNRHVKSLADNAVLAMKKAGYRHYGMEGGDAGEWVLVDFGGVVLHVMQPHIREFYDLERLWSTPRATDE